jgi:hypothetical protein
VTEKFRCRVDSDALVSHPIVLAVRSAAGWQRALWLISGAGPAGELVRPEAFGWRSGDKSG